MDGKDDEVEDENEYREDEKDNHLPNSKDGLSDPLDDS